MGAVEILTDGMFEVAQRTHGRVPPSEASLPPGPPLPRGVQLLGWLFRQFESLSEFRRRYGSPFTMRFPDWPALVIFDDPEVNKEIFTGPSDELHAGKANEPLRPIVGANSLLLLDGDRHLRERKLLLPPFHGARMHRYGEAMREITERDIARWPLGEVFAVQPHTQAITLDIILRTVFGLEEGSTMEALRESISTLIHNFSRPALMARQLQRDAWPPWARYVESRDTTDALLFQMIAERRSTPGGDDILSMMLEARHEDGAPMSEPELRDELMTLLAAGHETTATALSWTLHHLIEHPTEQHRVQQELDEVFPDGHIDPERVSELVFLDAVIKETLRIAPVIGGVGRVLQADRTIGGWRVPAGCMVAPSIYLTHHNERVHPEPDRFRPDRFLERKITPYEFFAFGGGVRRCIGMAFALYEMRIVLATLLSRHVVRRAPGFTIRATRRSVTMAPTDDMPLIVERR